MSDNNNDTDDDCCSSNRASFSLPPVLKDTQPHNAPQQEGIEGDQGTETLKSTLRLS